MDSCAWLIFYDSDHQSRLRVEFLVKTDSGYPMHAGFLSFLFMAFFFPSSASKSSC